MSLYFTSGFFNLISFFIENFFNNCANVINLLLPTNLYSSILEKASFVNFSVDSANGLDTFELHANSKLYYSSSMSDSIANSGEELSSMTRRQKASSPVVGYNFKVGDFYPSTTIKFYPSVFRSLSDVTRGVRRAA